MNVQLPVETLVLDREAATDQLAFTFQTSRLAAASDGKGGFVLTDDGSVPRFHVLPPTVTDATCKTGKVTLTLTDTAAVLTLDPTFAATAIYPMTIDPPVNWTTYPAYTTLGYDALAPLSELTVVSGDPNDPTQHQSDYTYDRVRNRLTRKQGQLQPTDTRPTTSYTYHKADRLQAATTNGTTVTYTVNVAGNLTSRVGGSINDSFTYDQANRLTGSTVTGSPTITASYAYNGDGLRVSKTVGATTTSYVWDLAAGLPVLLSDGTRKYVWGATGLAYNVTTSSGALEVYHKDHLDSIRELTASDQSVTTISLTDEYGVPTTRVGPDNTAATASTQPFWFTGELQDTDTGTNFVYLRARYYSPGEGRFITRDPAAALNRYVYGGNNSTNAADPAGLRTYVVTGAGGRCPCPDVYDLFQQHLAEAGVPDVRIYSSFGTPGGRNGDIGEILARSVGNWDPDANALASVVVGALALEPLAPGEQLNLIGYSGGAQTAIAATYLLGQMGVHVDFLVFVGGIAPFYYRRPANVGTWSALIGMEDTYALGAYSATPAAVDAFFLLPGVTHNREGGYIGGTGEPITIATIIASGVLARGGVGGG